MERIISNGRTRVFMFSEILFDNRRERQVLQLHSSLFLSISRKSTVRTLLHDDVVRTFRRLYLYCSRETRLRFLRQRNEYLKKSSCQISSKTICADEIQSLLFTSNLCYKA